MELPFIGSYNKRYQLFANGLTFPGAPAGCNLVQYSKEEGTGIPIDPTYFKVDNSWISLIADDADFGTFSNALKIFKFPSTNGTKFTDSVQAQFTALATDLGFPENPLFDSARFIIQLKMTSEIDGYGTIELMAGSYEVIRQKADQSVVVNVFLRNVLTGAYIAVPFGGDFNENTSLYTWIGKNSGNFYAQATADTIGNIVSVDFMLASSKGVSSLKDLVVKGSASKAFPVPATEKVTIETEVRKTTKADLVVFDILGNKVIEQSGVEMQSGANQLPLDIHGLKPGVYFYTIEGGGFKTSNKFVVK